MKTLRAIGGGGRGGSEGFGCRCGEGRDWKSADWGNHRRTHVFPELYTPEELRAAAPRDRERVASLAALLRGSKLITRESGCVEERPGTATRRFANTWPFYKA
jgi:hypothetical protein